jgi:hypothetical protein
MKGLDDVVLAALKEHPTTAVRPLVAALRDAGHEVTKSDVNAVLYRALERGAVVREGDSPPLWSLAGAEPMQHTTDPEWIIDRWLERTGERWSDAQRRAGAEGPRVVALAGFTEEELDRALADPGSEPLTWDTWHAAAVAARSSSIRV